MLGCAFLRFLHIHIFTKGGNKMLDKNGKILLWEVFNREEYNHYTHTPIGELLGHIVDNIEQCNRRSFICHEKSCEDCIRCETTNSTQELQAELLRTSYTSDHIAFGPTLAKVIEDWFIVTVLPPDDDLVNFYVFTSRSQDGTRKTFFRETKDVFVGRPNGPCFGYDKFLRDGQGSPR